MTDLSNVIMTNRVFPSKNHHSLNILFKQGLKEDRFQPDVKARACLQFSRFLYADEYIYIKA